MKNSLWLILFFGMYAMYAQVGIGTQTPEATLDVSSQNNGVLIPRFSNEELQNITNPVKGMLIYNISEHVFQQWDGAWVDILNRDQTELPNDEMVNAVTLNNQNNITNNVLNSASGLKYLSDGLFLSHNDGSATKALFKIRDTQPYNIVRTYHFPDLNLHDLEAISLSDDYVFLGDIGNNYGLKYRYIHFFSRDLLHQKSDTIPIEKIKTIKFYYPEHTNFKNDVNTTNFDAEAFEFYNDALHVFTKRWGDAKTAHYKIPFSPTALNEAMPAQLIETIDVGFLVTDVDIYNTKSESQLVLTGYSSNKLNVVLYFSKFLRNNEQFFNALAFKKDLGLLSTLTHGQVEGVSWWNLYSQRKVCLINEITLFTKTKISCFNINIP